MKLVFLGTRGYIDARSPRHASHTALLVAYRGRRVMIDCGEDWRGRVGEIAPHAIVVTHAHPDHAGGLVDGAPCPVHATEEGWRGMARHAVAERHVIAPRRPVTVAGIAFEAFPVEHSVRAPAVGYRVTAGRVSVFYAPDVVFIRDREAALTGVRLYVGDGATMSRSFVRRREGRLIGHAPVRTQLTWCRDAGVGRALITHCGSEIVAGDETTLRHRLEEWAAERGVAAAFAYDGMEVVLR